jgi:hypothetical protein
MPGRGHIRKQIEVELEYLAGRDEPKRGIFRSGVADPKFMDELWLDVGDDQVYDEATDNLVSNGKLQINLGGSRRALASLGKYLLALSEFQTEDPAYHDHFDDICDSTGRIAVHLILRGPRE